MTTENQKSVIIKTARDICTVSLREGETVSLNVGSVSLNTSEAVEFCETLKKAVYQLLTDEKH